MRRVCAFTILLVLILSLNVSTFAAEKSKDYNKPSEAEEVTMDSGETVGTNDISDNLSDGQSTSGGVGIMLMLSIGILMIFVFAVLFITHNKESIYYD